MAAAIIPIISLVTPLIPGVISFVEGLLGKGTGPQKKTTAVDILTKIIQDMANQGKVASVGTGVVDPGLPQMLADAVQKIFDQTKAVTGSGVPVVGGVPVVTGGVGMTQSVTLTIGKVIVTFPVSG
jgi:hypothetical protein